MCTAWSGRVPEHPVKILAKFEAEGSIPAQAEAGIRFDLAFTSTLKRAIRTLDHALEESDHMRAGRARTNPVAAAAAPR